MYYAKYNFVVYDKSDAVQQNNTYIDDIDYAEMETNNLFYSVTMSEHSIP